MIPCPYYFYFGVECFGCGFQRSLIALSHYDLYTSFRFFPGMIPLLCYFILELLRILKITWIGQNKAILFCGVLAIIIQVINYSLRWSGMIPWAHEIGCNF